MQLKLFTVLFAKPTSVMLTRCSLTRDIPAARLPKPPFEPQQKLNGGDQFEMIVVNQHGKDDGFSQFAILRAAVHQQAHAVPEPLARARLEPGTDELPLRVEPSCQMATVFPNEFLPDGFVSDGRMRIHPVLHAQRLPVFRNASYMAWMSASGSPDRPRRERSGRLARRRTPRRCDAPPPALQRAEPKGITRCRSMSVRTAILPRTCRASQSWPTTATWQLST